MSEEPKVDRNIADELGKLGQQVASAAKTVWESEERRKLQTELTRGIEKFSEELSATLDKAAEREEVKELRVKAEKVVEEVREADVIEEIRKGILAGLEVLNRELGKLVEKLDVTPDVPSTIEHAGEQAVETVAHVTEAAADAVEDVVHPKTE
jgi:predicted TIM-barrel fold metal-dependent hydrolase